MVHVRASQAQSTFVLLQNNPRVIAKLFAALFAFRIPTGNKDFELIIRFFFVVIHNLFSPFYICLHLTVSGET